MIWVIQNHLGNLITSLVEIFDFDDSKQSLFYFHDKCLVSISNSSLLHSKIIKTNHIQPNQKSNQLRIHDLLGESEFQLYYRRSLLKNNFLLLSIHYDNMQFLLVNNVRTTNPQNTQFFKFKNKILDLTEKGFDEIQFAYTLFQNQFDYDMTIEHLLAHGKIQTLDTFYPYQYEFEKLPVEDRIDVIIFVEIGINPILALTTYLLNQLRADLTFNQLNLRI
jgi:hypothetical protein